MPRASSAGVALLWLAAGCSGGTKYIGSNADPGEPPGTCAAPVAPPRELALDPFYAKYVDADGIPVLSSINVSDAALARACDIAVHLIGFREDVRERMIENRMRIAVMAEDEVTTDVPEHRDLYTAFPGTDWDRETRSVGATLERPVSSCGEENVLCLSKDFYAGESILVHSIAHGVRRLGIVSLDPAWDARLAEVYAAALANGLWQGTYAASDREQYWAEGVQDWYGANRESVPTDGIHNFVNTRSELRSYDPALADLIGEYFSDDAYQPGCP